MRHMAASIEPDHIFFPISPPKRGQRGIITMSDQHETGAWWRTSVATTAELELASKARTTWVLILYDFGSQARATGNRTEVGTVLLSVPYPTLKEGCARQS